MAAAKKGSKGGTAPKAAASAAPASAKPAPPVRAPKLDARTLGTRIGIPVAIAWVIALFVRHWIGFVVVGVLTAAALGLVVFALYFSRKTQRVQDIVGGAKTKEERKEALERLETEFKKDDAAATFAKAQLQLQEDPEAALATLEQIDLTKVMPNIADEARAQRAMIHLMLGQPQAARPLADAVDLGRHQDPKSKATLAAVVCEAWARTGQAKRALDILQLFDTNDGGITEARPGLLRAQVFAYGAIDDIKSARTAMHQLAKSDPRVVAGFAQKGVHPLLVQEAKKILERAGMLPKAQMRGPMR